MKYLTKKNAVAWDYYCIFGVVAVALAIFSLWFWTSTYQNKEAVKQEMLTLKAKHLEREMANTFDYVSNLMEFLGKRIVKDDLANNYPQVASLLKSELLTDEKMKEQYSWVLFDWNTPDNKMVVSTRAGVLPEPKDTSKRHYAKMAPKEPWKLHFDAADIGISSGEWIIPAGMGIANEGKLLGVISMGISVSRFTAQLERSGELQHAGFIVLDANHRVVFHSSHNKNSEIKENAFEEFFKEKPNNPTGTIANPVTLGNMTYSYYHQMHDYPFIIVAGYNNLIAAQDFKETVQPVLVGMGLIITLVTLSLLLIRYLTVRPIISLSQVVDAMREGKSVSFLRSNCSHEVRKLMLGLLKLYRAQRQEKRSKQQLTETAKLIETSDKTKEDFLWEMHRTFDAPIEAIRNGAYVAKEGLLGTSIKAYKKYFEAMYAVAEQLKNYSTDIVEYSQIDAKDTIEKCVSIQRKLAIRKQIQLTASIPQSIPHIWLDRLRFRQIILSTIHQSIAYTVSNGQKVHLSVEVENQSDGTPAFLIIKVEDNGVGMNEEERLAFEEQHKPKRFIEYDMMKLEISSIRHLVSLHQGQFEMKTCYGQGSTFIIKIPYLTDDETVIEAKEGMIDSLLALEGMVEKEEKKKEKSGNVIPFTHPDQPNT